MSEFHKRKRKLEVLKQPKEEEVLKQPKEEEEENIKLLYEV